MAIAPFRRTACGGGLFLASLPKLNRAAVTIATDMKHFYVSYAGTALRVCRVVLWLGSVQYVDIVMAEQQQVVCNVHS